MRPLDKVLERAENARKAGDGWLVSCPLPEHGKGRGDENPSVSISEGGDGRALVRCKAGCGTEDIVTAWGLDMRDLFERRNGHEKKFVSTPPKTGATVQPCTLGNYAAAKGLPLEFLKKLGLSDRRYQGRVAVRIPYLTESGEEKSARFRTALEKSDEGADRFKWRTGSKAMLYGLWRLEKIREAGWVVLVEGESDTQTLWYHGIPALGVPGVDTWKEAWTEHLEGVGRIYAVIEPDKGGETLKDKLSASGIRGRLHLLELGEYKDASELHLANPELFKESFTGALKTATAWPELERLKTEATARKARAECEDLVLVPNILERFATARSSSGVAGESGLAKLLYLAVTSRFLDRPVSVAMKGPSSGGKSYLTERVLEFFPRSAYHALTAMSEHALAYSEEPLSNRFLVIYEAAGMNSDFQTYLIRSLLSEGRVRYETVEKTSEGMKPRLIEREGPTGLIITTTAVKLHPENETRMLSLTVTDTNQQTRDVLSALAEEGGEDRPDMSEWHSLQEWLGSAEHRVTIPYSRALAQNVPPVAVRLRRDFGAMLNLIRAHAILHQASREWDAQGRIIATLKDYASVRGLVAELVSEGVEATVPPTVRETAETLGRLHSEESEPVTIAKLAEELKLDKSAAWRRVRAAIDRGYLKNLEDRKGRPARIVPGDPLPDDIEILPAVERLRGCMVAGESGGVETNFFSESDDDSESRKISSTPSSGAATVQPQSDERERFTI